MKELKSKSLLIYDPETGEKKEIDIFRGESAYEAAVRLGMTTLSEEQWVKEYDANRDAAIAAIEAKAKEALASIPEDYKELQADVESVKDCFNLATVNLFNPETMVSGRQLSVYGDLTDYNASKLSTSEYISIKPDRTYTITPYNSASLNTAFDARNADGTKPILTENNTLYYIRNMPGAFEWAKETDNAFVFKIPGDKYPNVDKFRIAFYTDVASELKIFEGETFNDKATLNVRVPYLDKHVKIPTSDVLCFGDSLTMGTSANTVKYPDVLQNLLGNAYTVYNYGVGGETAQQIAGRQGGVPIVVMPPLDIAPNANAVVELKSTFGSNIGLMGYQTNAGLHPTYLDGCQLGIHWNSENKQIFLNRG